MSNFFERFSSYLNGNDSQITDEVITTDKGDATTRMDIYRNAYIYRLIDILAGDFPTIYHILGTEFFLQAGERYLKRYPSNSYTVRHFGQHFAKFLSERQPYAEHPYLWQIADFEWAKSSVFDAPSSDIFTLEKLPSIPPEAWGEATFTFIPALKRLTYDYNVPQIWQAVENGHDNDRMPEPIALEKPLAWVMWRKELNPHWYSMENMEDTFFMHARRGSNFGMLCELLERWIDDEGEIAKQAATFVRRWIDEGILLSININ